MSHLPSILILISVIACGCRSEMSENTTASGGKTSSESLDFAALISHIDSAIGKRFQSIQMDAMNSASFQYDGPLKTVIGIVDPIAEKAGFTLQDDQPAQRMSAAEDEMQTRMGISVNPVDQRVYTHPNGDTLTVSRIDMSKDSIEMRMLTVQLMNPEKMSEFMAKRQMP